MKICSRCGSENEDYVKFCVHCGKSFDNTDNHFEVVEEPLSYLLQLDFS